MTQQIPNILKVVAFLLLVVDSKAQTAENELNNCNEKKHNLNRKGMVVLTSWASANILSAGACLVTKSPEEKYFYGMNAVWGVVNLSIAIPGLLGKKQVIAKKEKLYKDHIKTEKIFAINAALDIVYMGAGFGLKELAKNQSDINRTQMFSGFGNSFIMQGSWLLAFDLGMLALNQRNRKKHLSPLMNNTEVSLLPTGVNVQWRF